MPFELSGQHLGEPFSESAAAIDKKPVAKQITPQSRVLDLGWGNGSLSRILAAHAQAVLIIDASEPEIREAMEPARQAEILNLEYQVGDIARSLPNQICDRVFLAPVPERRPRSTVP